MSELPWLGVAALGLVATLSLEHFVVHRLIVLPTLEVMERPPFWMFAAMVVPELALLFAVGYRLRTLLPVAMYAGVGALVRSAYQVLLRAAGEPGHAGAANEGFSEFAMSAPVVALGYLLVLAFAAWSGEDERRLAGDGA